MVYSEIFPDLFGQYRRLNLYSAKSMTVCCTERINIVNFFCCNRLTLMHCRRNGCNRWEKKRANRRQRILTNTVSHTNKYYIDIIIFWKIYTTMNGMVQLILATSFSLLITFAIHSTVYDKRTSYTQLFQYVLLILFISITWFCPTLSINEVCDLK